MEQNPPELISRKRRKGGGFRGGSFIQFIDPKTGKFIGPQKHWMSEIRNNLQMGQPLKLPPLKLSETEQLALSSIMGFYCFDKPELAIKYLIINKFEEIQKIALGLKAITSAS